jgi:hypothetical protein
VTSASKPENDPVLAVLERGVTALPKDASYRYAKVGLFTASEAEHLDNLAELVAQYLERVDPSRPLCIAVFGAPGSGKSRLVKQLPSLMGSVGDTLAPLSEINLTQVTSLDNLAAALDNAGKAAGDNVPFVFFDEFDAKRDGAPWGWLSWFLAPMQDGAFLRNSERRELKRAIYVFAGGTSSSYEGFGRADRNAFIAAKGPDFVSRLRGYLNIPGVNADKAKHFRRAAVMHHQLKTHQKVVDASLRTALLNVGRYKHGARSVEALIELMPRKVSAVTVDDLREHPLLRMHVDRGPLDASVIGGWIGLSGSDYEAQREEYQKVWKAMGHALLSDGATLVCGGRLNFHGLMAQLELVVKDLPQRLDPIDDPWMVISRIESDTKDPRVHTLKPPSATPAECPQGLSDEDKKRWIEALKMFRMRHQLALRSVARFAVGGRFDSDPPGMKRFPGVAEELMLALAMKRPVYLSAALGETAQWVGELLGLGRNWTGFPPGFEYDWLTIPPQSKALFQPPPLNELPLTRAGLIEFFQSRALGGPNWVDNGLSPEENRQLFELGTPEFKERRAKLTGKAEPPGFTTQDAEEIAAFVRRGLLTLFAPHTL